MFDIEDDETNFYGSFAEYAQLQIDALEQATRRIGEHSGDLDTHHFLYSREVMSLIGVHFAGRLI